MEIAGKVGLVTGSASGLGLATARALVEAGAYVALLDLGSSDGAAAAEELGERAEFLPADVTRPEEVEAAVERVVERFGALHAAINCAGVATPGRVLSRAGQPMDLERFATVVGVNLIGSFNVLRVSAAQMARQHPHGEERGVIVNTSSAAAFEGQIGQAAYAASKGGVAGMTLSVARDLAEHLVRCISIAPGTFDTAMLAGMPEETKRGLVESIPHPHRLGRPEEYAALVVHVIENPMLNGTTIRLDAALRMPPR